MDGEAFVGRNFFFVFTRKEGGFSLGFGVSFLYRAIILIIVL